MLVDDLSTLKDISIDPDSVIVIGGGAVGLHFAVQLVRRGRKVVVLEAGSNKLDSFHDEAYEVVGRKHDGISIGRSVALGGTSNLWGGQLVEFMPIDLQGRDWLPGSTWPLSYKELKQQFGPTYDALGIDSDLQADGSVWSGIKKEPPQLSENLEVFLTRWLKQPNIATHYQEEINGNPDLIVGLKATAIGFVGEPGRLTGVRVVDSEGVELVVNGAQIVLAAGTIENARLLLHTAHEAPDQSPWAGNEHVGRWFQDHINGRLALIKPRNSKAFYDTFCTIVHRKHKFQPKVRTRNEALQSKENLNILAMIAFESSISENFIFLKQFVKAALNGQKFGSVHELVKNGFACSRHMIPLMWKFIVEHRILIPSGSRIALTVQAEVQPMFDSRIAIDVGKRDRFGLPKVLLDWRLSGRELEDLHEFTLRVEQAFRDADLADLQIEPKLLAKDPVFLDSMRDTNHHSGGCVMGDSPEDGVVDSDLRVFGVDNLYVAGASVYRTSSNANTTFTAMALATRLADRLAGTTNATH